MRNFNLFFLILMLFIWLPGKSQNAIFSDKGTNDLVGYNWNTSITNHAIIKVNGSAHISSKLIEQLLNQGFDLSIISDSTIEFQSAIIVDCIKAGSLNIYSKRSIYFENRAGIFSSSRLDIDIYAEEVVEFYPNTSIKSNGGDIKVQAYNSNKKIKRKPESSLIIEGTVDASSKSIGGRVILTADEVLISQSAKVFAKGADGGGKILIGGDWQGGSLVEMCENEDIHEAAAVIVKKGALIDASATSSGDGGKVVVWSNINHPRSNTIVQGSLYAMGGKLSGKGGNIETSGGAIDFDNINVSTLASDGSAGEWLIDPWNFLFNSSQLSTLANNLGSSNITVSTSNSSASGSPNTFLGTGHIEFQSDFNYTNANARTLTLTSNDNIWINGNISSSSGALSLVFDAPTSKGVFFNGDVSTFGGSVTFNNSPNIHFQKTSGVQSFNTGGGSVNFGTANLRLLRHAGSLEINTGSGTLNLGSGTVVSEGLFYALADANLVTWGGAHASGGKTYGVTVTVGRTYACRLYFWDSWDTEEVKYLLMMVQLDIIS